MMRPSRAAWLVLVLVTLAAFAPRQRAQTLEHPSWVVMIEDISPKFIDFYDAASAPGVTPDQRWALWKSKYDFAAVPPIATRDKIAREQLEEAWPKYAAAMPRLRRGAAGLAPNPQRRLNSVATLLGAQVPLRIRLITFVGYFHRNAFASGFQNGASTIAIPLEDSDQEHALEMTHEFTHAVQRQMGKGWDQQSVASAIFSEGLAMRVTQRLEPGLPTNDYSASSPEWFKSCQTRLPQVLAELKPHLADQGADAVAKFIYQGGSAGIDREIYCAGWAIVGDLQKRGLSLRRLGSMSRAEAEKLVGREFSKHINVKSAASGIGGTR
jgi:hypothetical protein